MSGPDKLEQLTELLALDVAGIRVTGATLYGRGSEAAVEVRLSNGSTLEFESVKAASQPQKLLAELAVVAHVTPTLKQPQCMAAIALIGEIAAQALQHTEVDQARDWGTSYLQAAETLDVDTRNQMERWAAFERLHERDPFAAARERGGSIASASIVLRDADGIRLVRTGWFFQHVRGDAPRVSHIRLPALMAQAGWQSPKRVKATHPARHEQRVWNFYAVPVEWGTDE